MELHQIRAFVTVAQVGNVTKAAEVLFLTQPAVTAQIKGLESSLGVALFERNAGGMRLTPAADRLLPYANQLLSMASELKGVARSMQEELTGCIGIGLPGETTDFLRTARLSHTVQTSFPLVEVQTKTKPVGQLIDLTRAGNLTGAFVISTQAPRDLQWLNLRSIAYKVAIPSRFGPEMAQGGWKVLASLPWVSGAIDSHTHQILRSLFERHGVDPRVVMRSEDTSTLESFVRDGVACSLLREEVAMPGFARNEWFVWGHAQIDAHLYFVHATDQLSDPLVVALRSAVQKVWGPHFSE